MKESFIIMTLYLNFISVVLIKYTDKKQSRGEMGLFQLTILVAVHHFVEVKSERSNS